VTHPAANQTTYRLAPLIALLSIGLGVLLGWLALSGLLALAFRRARILIRRMAERRKTAREGTTDRRNLERRA
jgi:uncharacterized membrane protein YciS (DUF1049 family)